VKILHLIDSAGLYGAERVLLHLAEEQKRGGLLPVIASIGKKGEGAKPLEMAAAQRGIAVAPFRMRPGPNLSGVRKILEFARQEKVDLLHSHGYKGNILFGLLPARFRRMPLLTTLHGWTGTRRLSRIALYEWLDRQMLPRLDAVVVVCRSMGAHPWIAARNLPLHVVCNGIPAPGRKVENRLEPGILQFCRGHFTIGAIGRLSPEKGFAQLIAAFKTVVEADRTARLLILGEGSERPALEAQIRGLDLDGNVSLPGFRTGAADYLPHFDLFVLPSLTEGLPLSVLEAMLAGVPVLATRVGAVPELLEEGMAGFLVADAGCLAAAIGKIRREAPEARQRADRARRRVQEHYSSSRMADGYMAVYRQLMRTDRDQ
jgi:glycosyltransferase involved in cell wall biosynthesis